MSRIAQIVLLAVLALSTAIGQDLLQSDVAAPLPVVASPAGTHADPSPEAVVAALRAQNELLREYQGHLLSTVYWSLASVAGLTVVLLGFGWYVNFRVYDRDKRALIQELRGTIVEEGSTLKRELDETTSTFARSIEERLRTREKQVAAAGEAAASVVHAKLTGDLRRVHQEILELRFAVTEMEADGWRARRVYTNEIRALLQMIGIAQSLRWDFQVSRTLDRILECFRSGARPDAQLAAELLAALGSLPAAQVGAVEGIRGALQASRT